MFEMFNFGFLLYFDIFDYSKETKQNGFNAEDDHRPPTTRREDPSEIHQPEVVDVLIRGLL